MRIRANNIDNLLDVKKRIFKKEKIYVKIIPLRGSVYNKHSSKMGVIVAISVDGVYCWVQLDNTDNILCIPKVHLRELKYRSPILPSLNEDIEYLFNEETYDESYYNIRFCD